MHTVVGLDFGTTNSAIAVGIGDGSVELALFQDGPSLTKTFRSILYFPAKDRGSNKQPQVVAGPDAIHSYLDAETKGRLMLSIKSYLASRLFTHTQIYGRSYTIEDLISVILRKLREVAQIQFGGAVSNGAAERRSRPSGCFLRGRTTGRRAVRPRAPQGGGGDGRIQ